MKYGNDTIENNRVKYDTDNLIYNRYDLIYKDTYERFCYRFEDKEYVIDAHYEMKKAVINTWGKKFPQYVFETVVNDIFQKHPEIRYIEFNRAGNNYHHLLEQKNDIRVPIPETVEALMMRLKPKHRYNLKRTKRLIEEERGPLTTLLFETTISHDLIQMYFEWKKATHGIDYGMSPEEYVKKYYVTHALLLKAGKMNIGIAFYCVESGIVYLENFSYDKALEKYSVGFLTYVMLLEELVKKRCDYLYLGGGEYSYKRHFGAEENLVYSGIVYSDGVFNEINSYFLKKNIKRFAIYGLGACGQAFLKIKDKLDLELVYGIDREERKVDGLPMYTLKDELPDVDVVMITLNAHNDEVEKYLRVKSFPYLYWIDFAKFGYKGIENESKTESISGYACL